MSRLKTNRNLATRRPRCFLGAVIGAVGSIASSIIGSNAQKRERRRQERAQDYTNMLETAKSDSAAMNSMLDYNRNYLSQFNTVARLGTSKRSKLNSNIFITDGGDAVKIDKDTYLLRGGSHEQTNETGQTGIGINVGGNEIEAEGGEVAQKKNGALRIFSAQPILGNGMSPAQAILRGYNKDKVFNAQQQFKKRNGLKDDGGKARHGTAVPYSRIHINDDGTFTDTLNNKNYTTSATNGEDVIITGKANHWKEAGKRFNSKYIIPSSLPEMAKRIILNKMDNWVDRNVFAPNNYNLGIIRNKLFYNLNPEGYAIPDENALPIYPEKRIKDALSDRNKGRNLFLNGTVKLRNPIYAKYLSIDSIPTEYGGKAAVNDILTKSKYQPTKGNEHNDYYKSTNDYYDEGDYTTGPLSDTNLAKALQYKTDNKKSTFVMPNTYDNVMGAYTVSFGKDRKGKYMSYYDKWDLNPFEGTVVGNEDLENRYNIGKAVHLYNRRYYTDKDSVNVMNKYRRFRNGFRLGGGLTSKDRGSSKHPYPSVSSKDFAGGGRSYPIPTKADAVDALRLAGLHGRSDVKARVYSRYPELRKKAEMGTIVFGGIPGTDSYKQRMYSGYNSSPLDLLNVLNYLDRAAGFVDEDGNSRYITGIAPTPGIRGRAKILNDLNRTNKVARTARSSRYFNSRQYHVQPRKTRVSETAVPVEQYNNGRYTYQSQFNKWQQGTPYTQTGYPNSHITVSTEPNDAIHGNVGSWWSDFKTRMDLKSQAKQKSNTVDINNRLHKQEVIDRLRRIKAASKQSKFNTRLNSYTNEQIGAMRPDSYWDKQMGRFINLSDKVASAKETGKYALTAGAIGAGASLYGISRIKSNNNNNVTQKDAKGKPISPYIAKPTTNNNVISSKQTPAKKQVATKSSTTRKPVVVSKASKPVSKKLYGLNDNETKTINGQTYVRRGNQVFNTTTKVRYDYANGKYTGHNKSYGVGDYSRVGKNFNDAFDAARAAGASRFRYNAGKYNQYTTAKETDAKKERLNRAIGSKRIAKRLGGIVLRPKARIGGSWTAPVYNTKKYRVSNRMRQQIATWEGSDFAGQNRKFKGDAIGAKERELRQLMGRTYNYLNDNQRDSLNSIYYNSRVDTFKNNFNKWFRNLNDAVDRGDERAFNNSLAGIRQSMTTGANRKGMSGLAKRRAWEQDWFGNPIPMDSNETKAILKQQADARMIQPVDNTRIVIQPQYIEVPTPVGHGIIPVDNPNPNLLQGNIKDNLINMGTKFRLGQRCGGSTRVRKALGGESRPVKGMRRKLAWGDVTYPYRRNNDFDYWTAINQEQKANDKGGITPWTTSNKYDVTPPLAITKTTPTIPYQNVVTPVTTKSKEDNGGSNNKSTNKLGATFKNVDWASLGADLIGTIGAGIIGAKTAGNIYIPDAPVRYQASKLDTNYNIVPQLETIRRSRNRLANEVAGNTSSSVAALNRLNLLENNANEQLNKLYDIKENRESELLNQDALNQQSVSAQNVQAMNDYNYRVAELKNLRTQGVGNVLSGTLQGIGNSFQNFFSQGRQNYDDTQAMLMGVAASDYATPSRLLELGVDVGDDATLAGIYHSAMNIPNPGARPKREDYSDNTEYSYALTRWENQNKAYQRRNSYADLIKGRMSRKNLSKYGII